MQWINSWFFVFARVAAIFSLAPVFGSRLIPVRIRLIIAFWIAIVIFPVVPATPVVDIFSPQGVALLMEQMLIGLSMAFILQLVFNAVTIAGEIIAMTMGLGFAHMVDPQNGIQVPVVSQLYVITSTLLFLALDGHILLLGLLNQSFTTLPIAEWQFDKDFVWQIASWASNMFIGALLISLPIVTGLLISNITMGVMARSSPQLNIFAVGFPATMLIGFVLMMLAMPAFLPGFSQLLDSAFDFLQLLLRIS